MDMKHIRRTETEYPVPAVFFIADNYGQGWFYAYDRQQTGGIHSYVEVRFDHEPTAAECIGRIIRMHVTDNEEFDIINSYNKAQMGMLDGAEKTSAVNSYKDYLELLDTIKSRVRSDFEGRGKEIRAYGSLENLIAGDTLAGIPNREKSLTQLWEAANKELPEDTPEDGEAAQKTGEEEE